jgi:cytochrome P450
MAMKKAPPPDFDLTDPASFRLGHPFAAYDRMRATQPVCRNPVDDGSHPLWLLTRHADVEAVARDNVNFTSAQGFRIQERGSGIALLKPHIREAVASTLLTMDPPRHGDVRRPMQAHFLPSALRRLEAQVDGFVRTMVADLPAGGEI